MLETHNIVSVVNCCQMPNKFESTDKDNDTIAYLRFPIANWRGDSASLPLLCATAVRHHFDMATHAGTLGYFEEAVALCEATFEAGGSVLVHCAGKCQFKRRGGHRIDRRSLPNSQTNGIFSPRLHVLPPAGAHRGGTAGTALLMILVAKLGGHIAAVYEDGCLKDATGGSARRILNAADAVASVQQVTKKEGVGSSRKRKHPRC
jgi:hypothetical protein